MSVGSVAGSRAWHRRASTCPWLDEIPAHWRECRLSLVARLGSGHTPSRSRSEWWEDCTIPWITTGEVAQMRDDGIEYIAETREMISETGVENSSAVVHPAGTVVLSRTASAGYSAIMGRDMATSQDFVTWTCDPVLDPRFLLLCLRAMRGDLLGRLAMGSTHKTIYMPDIEAIRIPLPPVSEQGEIVEEAWTELYRIDALIDAKEQMLELGAAWLRSTVDEAFARLDAPVVALRRYTRSLTQGVSSPAGNVAATSAEWGVLKLSAVKWGRFIPEENKVLPEESQVDESLQPAVGDLLVTRSNTPAYVGDVCTVVEPPGRVLLPDLIYRLQLIPGLDPAFVSYALRTSAVRATLSAVARGTSGSMVKLRGEDITGLKVPAPDERRQRDVTTMLDEATEAVDDLTDILTRQISLLRERRQALITAAVTGEMEIP